MTNEGAFLIALTATLLLSVLVVLYLRRPLHRILVDLCGAEHRAWFWSAYSNVVLLLVPAAALLVAGAPERPGEATVFTVVNQFKWALVGLLVAVFLVAMGVATFIWPARTPVSISPTQVDELQRLLAKVEAIRAREVLSRDADSQERTA
jgi:hypothetical protein